jgi:hypothetical protein
VWHAVDAVEKVLLGVVYTLCFTHFFSCSCYLTHSDEVPVQPLRLQVVGLRTGLLCEVMKVA